MSIIVCLDLDGLNAEQITAAIRAFKHYDHTAFWLITHKPSRYQEIISVSAVQDELDGCWVRLSSQDELFTPDLEDVDVLYVHDKEHSLPTHAKSYRVHSALVDSTVNEEKLHTQITDFYQSYFDEQLKAFEKTLDSIKDSEARVLCEKIIRDFKARPPKPEDLHHSASLIEAVIDLNAWMVRTKEINLEQFNEKTSLIRLLSQRIPKKDREKRKQLLSYEGKPPLFMLAALFCGVLTFFLGVLAIFWPPVAAGAALALVGCVAFVVLEHKSMMKSQKALKTFEQESKCLDIEKDCANLEMHYKKQLSSKTVIADQKTTSISNEHPISSGASFTPKIQSNLGVKDESKGTKFIADPARHQLKNKN